MKNYSVIFNLRYRYHGRLVGPHGHIQEENRPNACMKQFKTIHCSSWRKIVPKYNSCMEQFKHYERKLAIKPWLLVCHDSSCVWNIFCVHMLVRYSGIVRIGLESLLVGYCHYHDC